MKTVRASILTGFIIVLFIGLLLGVAGIVSIRMIQVISSGERELQDTRLEISGVLNAHYNWRQTLTEAVLNGTGFTGSLDPTTCAFGVFLGGEIVKGITDAEALRIIEEVKQPHDYIHIEAREIQTLLSAGNLTEARDTFTSEILPETAKVISMLNDLEKRYTDLIENQIDELSGFEVTAIIIIILLVAAAVAIGIFISVYLANKIEKSLRDIIDKLVNLSNGITASANQLGEASSNLAQGSSEQAAAIEQTSATMNETSSMVEQNAENTRLAAQIASDSTKVTNEAGKFMMMMMETLGELKNSSDSVGRIVKTIDGIASQTNLLAINATVEAARAGGDAGRSFGVVAEEVRNLAQKSASAAAQTTEIIDKNISLTDETLKEAETVMELAKKSSGQMSDLEKLISEISAASEEQSSGIKQINIAISQMESVTQENAAVAEQTSAASNSMQEEVIHLGEVMQIAENLVRNKT